MAAGGSETRQEDDRELQPLGLMHRHHPHHVFALGQAGRVAFGVSQLVEGTHERDEPGQIRTFERFVVGRHAHQLADVRESALALRGSEQTEVVVAGGDRVVDESGQPRPAHAGAKPIKPSDERVQSAPGRPGQGRRRLPSRTTSQRERARELRATPPSRYRQSSDTPTSGERRTVTSERSSWGLTRSRRSAATSATSSCE